MTTEQDATTRIEVKVGSVEGLHARPAAVLVQAARSIDPAASIGYPEGPQVNPRSLAMVLSLNADFGDLLVVESSSPASARALADLVGRELDRVEEGAK